MLSLTHRKTAPLPADATTLHPVVGWGRGWGRLLGAGLSARMVTDLIIGAYGCALALLGAIAAALLADRGLDHDLAPAFDPMALGFVAAGFVLICIGASGISLHGLRKFGASLRKTIAAFACALVALALVAWSTGRPPSHGQGTIWLWFVLGCGGLAALQGGVCRWLRESRPIGELCARRVAIVSGDDRTCARFLDLLLAQQDPDLRLLGVFHAGRGAPAARPGRTLEDLVDLVRRQRVDEVFIALPWHAERRISALVDRLGHLPVDLKLCPDRVGYAQAMVIGERLAGVPVATLHRQPIRDWGRLGKRTIDVVLGATALVLFALPMAAIALAIRLDSPGPILFRQQRQGFNHDVFEMLKFRTMRHDPGGEVVLALVGIPGDPRVTRVGRWLRRTSLDELPQLINVLRGEMSLVGPRPHAIAVDVEFMERIRRYATRRRVKPGITGLAQVNGWRGAVDTEEKMAGRVLHDLYYIENWSLLLDLEIIALTVLTGFAYRNAH
ncbi:MAG: exopolysaccharide biosynthesis polyprenyl glycosylphosphotransferase [Geminicoccaceae bacterium]